MEAEASPQNVDPRLELSLDTTDQLADALLDDWSDIGENPKHEADDSESSSAQNSHGTVQKSSINKPLPAIPYTFEGQSDYTEDVLEEVHISDVKSSGTRIGIQSAHEAPRGQIIEVRASGKSGPPSKPSRPTDKEFLSKDHRAAVVSGVASSHDSVKPTRSSFDNEATSTLRKGHETLERVKTAFRERMWATESDRNAVEDLTHHKELGEAERKTGFRMQSRTGRGEFRHKEQPRQVTRSSHESKHPDIHTTAKDVEMSNIQAETIPNQGTIMGNVSKSPEERSRRPSDFSNWVSPLAQHTDVEFFSSSPMDHSTPNARFEIRAFGDSPIVNGQRATANNITQLDTSTQQAGNAHQVNDEATYLELHKRPYASKRQSKDMNVAGSPAPPKKTKKEASNSKPGDSLDHNIEQLQTGALKSKDPNRKLSGIVKASSGNPGNFGKGQCKQPHLSDGKIKGGKECIKQHDHSPAELTVQHHTGKRQESESLMSLFRGAEFSEVDELQMDSPEYQIGRKR
ncbi:hypothetical protein L228DRAFT_274981 [Xylona heveae TC161]|uniref:Uncharacterized protein n=1 Tax=Xylona heveae (strain CBS 132557 / TC161) TaxID=1328760 RepID=A0A165J1M0_XYLHT|nr:hypothetical protein L228DRAFT_274981 [Xylona heveae TC161]KZF25619.1 hypothetical protein L228DRAFT_274981 [Xylona heveae TC161]